MRSMTAASETLFRCPNCERVLPVRPPCACGFILREFDGIIDLVTKAEISAAQPFLEAYELVRMSEQWGGDDLDLPFRPKRHQRIWKIRQRTFRALESAVANIPRELALDVGAGNCWLTRYLDQWGFGAIAVDLNASPMDGLRAGQTFIDNGAAFLRIRCGMERLPFVSNRIRLLATNASFHYASDFRAALAEFKRVLTPGGIIAIIDTPFYENSADGERMIAQRVVEFRTKYKIPESVARQAMFLTYKQMEELAQSLALSVRINNVGLGLPRKIEEIRGKLAGRRIADFPLVVLEKR
jgi:ubiquinone/menaquinone biosynthesis C-methylase UbiE